MLVPPIARNRMTRIDPLFDRYAESHRNAVNKAIHWVCVPLITWSLLAALWSWTPAAAVTLIFGATIFYARLSPPLAVGMLGVSAMMVAPLALAGWRQGVLLAAAAVFAAAWVGQFIGHHIEGRKPSFVDDVKFLLVGPAWLLASVYRRIGIAY
jgi:uncharacterized membrane protein YGL010W